MVNRGSHGTQTWVAGEVNEQGLRAAGKHTPMHVCGCTHARTHGVMPPSWHHKLHGHTMPIVHLKAQGAERPQRAYVKTIRQGMGSVLKVM